MERVNKSNAKYGNTFFFFRSSFNSRLLDWFLSFVSRLKNFKYSNYSVGCVLLNGHLREHEYTKRKKTHTQNRGKIIKMRIKIDAEVTTKRKCI